MNIPIVFCHYGNSTYLPYVFEMARASNPDKTIILLGDKSNQWIQDYVDIQHHFFDDYEFGSEIALFNKTYQLIQGRDHINIKANKDWVNFVFKRWFYIYNFLHSQEIDNFWHFDSDNMIVDALSDHEYKFRSYDCSEQCNGKCLNGYISSRDVVFNYITMINELFQNQQYLQDQQREFDQVHHNFAFTEMRAYEEFKRRPIDPVRLNTVIDGSTFDDAICQEHGMEMDELWPEKTIKKVYMSDSGEFYCYEVSEERFVRMNSLNLSWVPDSLFQIVLAHGTKAPCWREGSIRPLREMPTLGQVYRSRHPIEVRLKRLRQTLRKVKSIITAMRS